MGLGKKKSHVQPSDIIRRPTLFESYFQFTLQCLCHVSVRPEAALVAVAANSSDSIIARPKDYRKTRKTTNGYLSTFRYFIYFTHVGS